VASLSQGRTAAAQCGLFTHKSVPVIFEPPCTTLNFGAPNDLPQVCIYCATFFGECELTMLASLQSVFNCRLSGHNGKITGVQKRAKF